MRRSRPHPVAAVTGLATGLARTGRGLVARLARDLAARLGAWRELPLAPGERRMVVAVSSRSHQGHEAEVEAERYLRLRGCRILCRRRANRHGELDLVVLEGETVVFVEVRSRAAHAAVSARDTLTAAKRRHLAGCVELFVRQHGLEARPRRMDLIAVTHGAAGAPPQLEHLTGVVGARVCRPLP